MGVTYKLKDEVVAYIIQQRQDNANLSCRALAEGVEANFGVHLSKSSVHEVLKEAHIASPRGRKPKDAFAIPAEKKQLIKAKLSEALISLVSSPTAEPLLMPTASPPALTTALPAFPEPMTVKEAIVQPLEAADKPSLRTTEGSEAILEIASSLPLLAMTKTLPEPQKATNDLVVKEILVLQKPADGLIKEQIPQGAGLIFLKAAFWDLAANKLLGIDRFEDAHKAKVGGFRHYWEYLTTLIRSIKVTLEDGHVYFLSARLEGVDGEDFDQSKLAAPIERVLKDVADRVLNNIKPLIIKRVESKSAVFYDFLGSLLACPGKKMRNISIVGYKDHVYAEFDNKMDYERHFIVISDVLVDVSCESGFVLPLQGENGEARVVRAIRCGQETIVTNLPQEIGDERVLAMYEARHDKIFKIKAGQESSSATQILIENVETQGFEEKLKARAKAIFAPQVEKAVWEQVYALAGEARTNKLVYNITIYVPAGYVEINMLTDAMNTLNAMGVEDDQGRRVYVAMVPLP